jgi:hypothetical protein
MEPTLSTDPELSDVLAELRAREPIFHRPEFGTTRADFEKMTVQDFWEVGASGRRYSRAYVLDELERRHAAPQEDVWEATEFYCRKLADGIYLLTYTLLQNRARLTRRSSIWQRQDGAWKIVYHQGTVVQEGQGDPLIRSQPPGWLLAHHQKAGHGAGLIR